MMILCLPAYLPAFRAFEKMIAGRPNFFGISGRIPASFPLFRSRSSRFPESRVSQGFRASFLQFLLAPHTPIGAIRAALGGRCASKVFHRRKLDRDDALRMGLPVKRRRFANWLAERDSLSSARFFPRWPAKPSSARRYGPCARFWHAGRGPFAAVSERYRCLVGSSSSAIRRAAEGERRNRSAAFDRQRLNGSRIG